jgi:hypothetical protein
VPPDSKILLRDPITGPIYYLTKFQTHTILLTPSKKVTAPEVLAKNNSNTSKFSESLELDWIEIRFFLEEKSRVKVEKKTKTLTLFKTELFKFTELLLVLLKLEPLKLLVRFNCELFIVSLLLVVVGVVVVAEEA